MKTKKILYNIFIKYQLLVVLLIGFDQLTKLLANDLLTLNEPNNIIGSLVQFKLVYNTGIAFSLFNSMPSWTMFAVSLIGFGAIEYYVIKKKPDDKVFLVCLLCIAAGAFGNGIDRFLMLTGVYEGVIDFISISFFPAVFNVADIYVTCTCVFLIAFILFSKDDSELSMKELKEAKKRLEEEAKNNQIEDNKEKEVENNESN